MLYLYAYIYKFDYKISLSNMGFIDVYRYIQIQM